jgi:hypothetical protein
MDNVSSSVERRTTGRAAMTMRNLPVKNGKGQKMNMVIKRIRIISRVLE